MNTLVNSVGRFNGLMAQPSEWFADLVQLALRLYVSWIFFPAGWLKIQDWETTLLLFEYEYSVPLLSPQAAAWLGTAGELIFPALLVIGLLTRFSALGLCVVNAVAVVSLSDVPPAAMSQHLLWGLGLLVLMVWGGGRASVDHLILRSGYTG